MSILQAFDPPTLPREIRNNGKARAPRCPLCGAVAIKENTPYGPKYTHCGLWAWGRHPLVDGATHRARRAAHAAFDPIWQSGRMGRSQAYHALAEALGIDARDCHMKLMSRAMAERVPGIAKQLLSALLGPPTPNAGKPSATG